MLKGSRRTVWVYLRPIQKLVQRCPDVTDLHGSGLVGLFSQKKTIYIYTRIYYVDTTVYIVKGSTVLWGNVPLRPASCIWHHLAARQRHKLSSSRIHDIKDPLHAQVSEQDSKDTQFWVANGWHYKAPATMSEWLRFHVVSGDMAHLHDTSLCMSCTKFSIITCTEILKNASLVGCRSGHHPLSKADQIGIAESGEEIEMHLATRQPVHQLCVGICFLVNFQNVKRKVEFQHSPTRNFLHLSHNMQTNRK